MRKLFIAAAVVAAVSYATVKAAKPQAQRPMKAAAAVGEEIHATAEVVKVSKFARTVTVRNAEGEKMKVKIPREVQNLDQIKPGSMLNISYVQAAAVAIGKPGAAPVVEEETVAAPMNSAPGEEISHTRFVVGRIEGVDLDKRELKVKGPDGEIITLSVAPGVAGFEDAKIGDSAAVRFTEAVALVATPKSGKANETSPRQ